MPPPLPGYDLARVLATRDRIVAKSEIHVGSVLVGEYYADWLALVGEALPDVPDRALALSTRSLLDRLLTDASLHELAWRLAGNLRALRAGRTVTGWTGQPAEEWMPLRVTKVQPGRNRKDEPGHWLAFRVLAGTACPQLVRRFWTRPQSRFVASRLGFNPRAGRPFPGAAHFVGLVLYGLFEPRLCEERPGFHQVQVSASLLDYNVGLIKGRAERPCPTGPYHYTHPCDACTVGYDRCPLALHARTYEPRPCPGCQESAALFDPEQPEYCLACLHARYLKGEK